MKTDSHYTRFALWANRIVALVTFLLVFFLPAILNWYVGFRPLSDTDKNVIIASFYCCVVVIETALWNVERLLRSIRRGDVFTRYNVTRIRRICYCCGGVGLICIPAALCYLPLIFLVIIMGFLCLMISVVVSVMNAAVEIREENDLTI